MRPIECSWTHINCSCLRCPYAIIRSKDDATSKSCACANLSSSFKDSSASIFCICTYINIYLCSKNETSSTSCACAEIDHNCEEEPDFKTCACADVNFSCSPQEQASSICCACADISSRDHATSTVIWHWEPPHQSVHCFIDVVIFRMKMQ